VITAAQPAVYLHFNVADVGDVTRDGAPDGYNLVHMVVTSTTVRALTMYGPNGAAWNNQVGDGVWALGGTEASYGPGTYDLTLTGAADSFGYHFGWLFAPGDTYKVCADTADGTFCSNTITW
jgi:hypothetical protein